MMGFYLANFGFHKSGLKFLSDVPTVFLSLLYLRTVIGTRQTDRRTDGQTDRRTRTDTSAHFIMLPPLRDIGPIRAFLYRHTVSSEAQCVYIDL